MCFLITVTCSWAIGGNLSFLQSMVSGQNVTPIYQQFVKGKGFFVCDVRVAAHTQNCPKNGPLKARLMA